MNPNFISIEESLKRVFEISIIFFTATIEFLMYEYIEPVVSQQNTISMIEKLIAEAWPQSN